MKALRDYLTNEEDKSVLHFKKNDVIKLVNNHHNHEEIRSGLIAGVLNNRQDRFPFDYMRPITRDERYKLTKSNREHVFQPQNMSCSGTQFDCQDGHFSMMEFAMLHFKQSIDK